MSKKLAFVRSQKNDELYTPRILVDLIIPYIPKGSRVWCPFDTANSEFVQACLDNFIFVTYSHIKNGHDFLTYNPTIQYDYIVSNPPFSIKLKVFEKLYKLNKPFAMVMGLPVLNYQEIGNFFLNKPPLQLLMPDKKVSFDGSTASFNNSFFCHKMLKQDNTFVHLPHNNTGENFVPSRMYQEIYGDNYTKIMGKMWRDKLIDQKKRAKKNKINDIF